MSIVATKPEVKHTQLTMTRMRIQQITSKSSPSFIFLDRNAECRALFWRHLNTALYLGWAARLRKSGIYGPAALQRPLPLSFCTLLGSLLQRMSSRRPILRFCPSQPLMNHLCSCKIAGLRTVKTYCEGYLPLYRVFE